MSIGCRSALAPSVSRNRAPETWITAAPQDTITTAERGGIPTPAEIHTIPVRFHIYWAGSDIDGAVTGFYWAVVETLPLPPEGSTRLAPLPGPRPSSYHFTTRTDSTFEFKVSEFRPDRQHAFFIYSVDEKGKVDPTPARFIFNALDRFPPLPILTVAQGTGRIARVLGFPGNVVYKDTTVVLRDSLDLRNLGRAPRDTVPSGARLDFRWIAEPTTVGGYAVKYKYKLDEPTFVEVDSATHSVSYNAGLGTAESRPGTKQLNLRALDASDGAREITRRFQMNWRPDTWFAGPDPGLVPLVPFTFNDHYLQVGNWKAIPPLPGSQLSCDSLLLWPSERIPRKTFWEVYRDRLYLHAENDTVSMNSVVIISAGGSDLDSKYDVQVSVNDPVKDTLVCAGTPRALRPGDANGSPIGMRFQYSESLDLDYTTASFPSQSGLYPLFDAASTFRNETINGYSVFNQSGRVYIIVRAQDGDGATDDRFSNARAAQALADDVDSGLDTDPRHVALRSRVLTFYVNRNPFFNFGDPTFFPKPAASNGGVIASSPSRTLRLSMPASDPDPYDFATRPQGGGGPSSATILRKQVTVTGGYTVGGITRDTSYVLKSTFTNSQIVDLAVDAPAITGTDLMLDIQLCDCANCEAQPGSGRCVTVHIPVTVPPPPPLLGSGTTSTHPTGLSVRGDSNRSYQP